MRGSGGALAPLGERPFRQLWLGRASSAIGDALVPVAIAFAVLGIDHSATALGVVLASYSIPRVVLTLAGGVVGDRLSRRTVMLVCDGVRAGVEAMVAVLLLTGRMTLPLFVLAGVLYGSASAFFGPASTGLVPQTVPREQLQRANALLALSQRAMLIGGPVVSGLVVAAAGTGWVFAVDAASFVASAMFLWRLRIAEPPRVVRAFASELAEGFREVRSRPWVIAALGEFAIVNLGTAAFVVLGPVIVERHLGGARGWGVVLAAGAVGGLAGGTLALRRRPRRPLQAVFVAGACIALPQLALSDPAPLAVVAAAYAAGLGASAYGSAVWEATLQERIPTQALSRVSSYDWLVSLAVVPVGLAATGPLAGWVGARSVLVVCAAAIVATSVFLSAAVRGRARVRAWHRPRLRRSQVRTL